MRVLAFLATLLAMVGAAFAGNEMLRVWTNDTIAAKPVSLDAVQTRSQPSGNAPRVTQRWPHLFGEPQPPAPPAPAPEPVAQPQPPKPPAPPLDSLGFSLKGVVTAGDTVWGLVSHPTGERILRIGDPLDAGYVVQRIDAQGLWVSVDQGEPQLLAFPES